MTDTDRLKELAGKRTRMTLDLSPRLNAEVERLAESRGASKADIFRAAIEGLAAAYHAKEEGYRIGAWSSDRSLEREFMLP